MFQQHEFPSFFFIFFNQTREVQLPEIKVCDLDHLNLSAHAVCSISISAGSLLPPLCLRVGRRQRGMGWDEVGWGGVGWKGGAIGRFNEAGLHE